jgi:hypothetical protein
LEEVLGGVEDHSTPSTCSLWRKTTTTKEKRSEGVWARRLWAWPGKKRASLARLEREGAARERKRGLGKEGVRVLLKEKGGEA